MVGDYADLMGVGVGWILMLSGLGSGRGSCLCRYRLQASSHMGWGWLEGGMFFVMFVGFDVQLSLAGKLPHGVGLVGRWNVFCDVGGA